MRAIKKAPKRHHESAGQRQLRTPRLFSLHLADHDRGFAPYRRRISFHWLKFLLYVPALACFLAPSFHIGRIVVRQPELSIPDEVAQGEIFVISRPEETEQLPLLGGRILNLVDSKEPLYAGAALAPFDLEVSVHFKDEVRPRWKGLIEKFEHPTLPLFVKRLHVNTQEPSPEPTVAPKGHAVVERVPPPPFSAKEAEILKRFDGKIHLRCWKHPVVDPHGLDPLRPRRAARLGSLPAAGGGQVVYTGAAGKGFKGSVALLYHGGGLFTRYWGLKDVRVRRGRKIRTGEIVGNVFLAPPRLPTPANWQPFLHVGGAAGPVSPASVLALSSRLCGSK